MRFGLKTLTILGVLGAAATSGVATPEAQAQLFRGRRGGYGPGGYGTVYVPVYPVPVTVVSPGPVVVTESRYVVTTPTYVRRQVIQAAPVVETRIVQPAAVEERRVVQPPPVVETRLVQPPPVVERRVVQPPPVYERRVVQPAPVVETDVLRPVVIDLPPLPTPY